MSISFDSIPAGVRVPGHYIEFNSERAQSGASLQPYTSLIIGQRLAAGTVAALTPTLITSAVAAATAFGEGSMLHGMAQSWFANNSFTKAIFIALDDAGGSAAAAGTITFTGTTTAAGTIHLLIAGRKVSVGVSSGATGTTIAAAVAAAITAATSLPVTAAVDGGDDTQVNLTARNKGTVGNQIDVRVNYYEGQATPAGVTTVIVGMAAGATDPDLDTVWAALPDDHYNVLATPYSDAPSLTSIETELADRWGPMRAIEGVAFVATGLSHASALSLGNGRNSPHVSIMSAYGSPTPPYEWAAALAGTVSYFGNIDPARPFQNLTLQGVLPAASTSRFTVAERDLLLHDGISTSKVSAGGEVLVERLITTYQENAAGGDDIAYLDVTTPLTLGYLRYDFRTLLATRYPRHKLGVDGKRYGAGQKIMTPGLMRGEAVARFLTWEGLGLVEDAQQFERDLLVERNSSDANRLDIYMSPNLINGFRVSATQIAFIV